MNFEAIFPGLIRPLQPFDVQYRCFSMALCQQTHLSDERVKEMNNGGKILLPQSALDHLTRLHINYPMMFKITNMDPAHQRVTHAGVMEFHQEEGKCFMPHWMMRNLILNEGDRIRVEYVNLPTGSYVKLQPQSADFLDISNPRAVLELQLRNFSCLTKSDIIAIHYNNKSFEFLIEELKPAPAVCIIECDMNVEFSKPVGYIEPDYSKPKEQAPPAIDPSHLISAVPNLFIPFGGKGNRTDGKSKPSSEKQQSTSNSGTLANASDSASHRVVQPRGIPDYNYRPGRLTFIRTAPPKQTIDSKAGENSFKPFSGSGQSVKSAR